MYYRGAAAAILVYDITRAASYDTLRNWVRELQANGPADIVMAVVGNKCDLADQRQVSGADAEAYSTAMDAQFTEASAKADTNISDVFASIAARLPPPDAAAEEDDIDLRMSNKQRKQTSTKGGCC
jgi:GTPase SAR1 family protein